MKKEKMFNGCFGLMALAVVVLLSSCASNPNAGRNPEDALSKKMIANAEARKFNLVLLDAIQDADRIVIREHSDKNDFFGIVPELETPPEYTYATKELTIGDKILFLDEVRVLRGEAKIGSVNSLFTPHHTIDFYEQGALKSSMKINFSNSALNWNGTNQQESQDVFKALNGVVTRAGMQPNRAWDELAKQQYFQQNQAQPPRRDFNQGGVPTAKWAPGQVGRKVINPYTGKLVDVEGIPANTKVRDPNDSDPSHIFRVPGI